MIVVVVVSICSTVVVLASLVVGLWLGLRPSPRELWFRERRRVLERTRREAAPLIDSYVTEIREPALERLRACDDALLALAEEEANEEAAEAAVEESRDANSVYEDLAPISRDAGSRSMRDSRGTLVYDRPNLGKPKVG